MSYIVAIFDNDIAYANQLMAYMKRKQKAISQVRVFTNLKNLQDYYADNKIDVLLLSENIPIEEVKDKNVKNICLLSEGNHIRESIEFPIIYKFQSAEHILQEIFSYYPLLLQKVNSSSMSNNKVKFISVISMGNKTEQTVMSLSLAKQYSKQRKTLYVNLDTFQAIPELFGHNRKKSLSDFIYYLKQNNSNLIMKMKGAIEKVGSFDSIPGVSFGSDLYELTVDDMTTWLEELRKTEEYEVVIFEVGSIFEASLRLFQECSQVMILLNENEWEQAKYRNLKEQFLFAGYEEVLDKCRGVTLTTEEQNRVEKIQAGELLSEYGGELAAAYVEEETASTIV